MFFPQILLIGEKTLLDLSGEECCICICILGFVHQGAVAHCVWVGALLKGCEEEHC